MREMLRFVALSRKFYMVLMISKHYEPGLPVVAFRFSEAYRTKYPDIKQKWIQTLLRAKGWIVPNYELAPDLSEIEILRVVVRETVSEVLIERLLGDLVSLPVTAPAPPPTHHPVYRSISPSLLPKTTPPPTLSAFFPTIPMASATRSTMENLTRTLPRRVLAPTPNNVKKQTREMKKIEECDN